MKVVFEIDTDSENYDSHELWLLQNAENMWSILCELRSELREKWKYGTEQKLDKDKLWDMFHEIIHKYHLNSDDII